MEKTYLPERTENVDQEILRLSEALLLYQRELAQIRVRQEEWHEQSARARKESATARKTAAFLSQALAQQLSRTYWEERQPSARISWRRFIGSRWPWLKRMFGGRKSRDGIAEQQQVRLIEASRLFQSDWYLRNNADVAMAGVNPAAHYLRTGADEGRDPGPGFNTSAYVAKHPELVQSGLNPLVHYLQSQKS